jgi:zinc transporter, ZIP family
LNSYSDIWFDYQNVLIAFGVTVVAGLATGIGSTIAFFAKKTNTKFLSLSLGFSAGVMIYISFVEIFAKAQEILIIEKGSSMGQVITVSGFFAGMLLIAIIDRMVPNFENPHEIKKVEEIAPSAESLKKRKLYRMGVMSAVAIAVHNFPEGIATFLVTLQDFKLGLPIAVAIAIHNIPEGIAISVPIYHSTGSKKKAFKYSFLSGLAEPLGALFAVLILTPFLNQTVFGFVFASVAGIMVFISIDELLPAAREYGRPHLALYGLISGMAVMAISLILL